MNLRRTVRDARVLLLVVALSMVIAACGSDEADDLDVDTAAEPADDAADESADEPADEPGSDEDEPAPDADAEAVTLNAVSFLPVDHDLTEPLPLWVDAVEDATDGQVVVSYDRGPESIPQFDQIDAVQSGVVDINFNVTAFYEDQAPELRAFGLSELTPWEEREGDFYDLMVESHERIGLRYLGRWLSEQPFFLWTNEPVASIDDFTGLRIRTAANYDRFLNSIGASPVTVETAEVFTSLESGLVDGLGWPILGPLDLGWTDHAPYLVDHPFFNQNAAITMNLDVWNGLSPELQDSILEATAEFEREMTQFFIEASEAERELLLEAGVEFIQLEDGEEYEQRPYDVEWEWLEGQVPDLADELRAAATAS